MIDDVRFCRIQNLHISQTQPVFQQYHVQVLQNSKFTYLSNHSLRNLPNRLFCRIQNLHISQTMVGVVVRLVGFVEFKIYISLKLLVYMRGGFVSFVEFKIYISLKLIVLNRILFAVLQNSKFTYLSNLRRRFGLSSSVLQNSKFTYLSNEKVIKDKRNKVLQNSKFTYLSNLKLRFGTEILNLGIKKWIDTDPARRQFR